MTTRLHIILIFCLILGTLAFAMPPGQAQLQALQSPEQCRQALADKEQPATVRRHAFRKLLYSPDTASEAIERGLTDGDAGIRALATFELYRRDGAEALPRLTALLQDKSTEVGIVLTEVGRTLPDRQAGLDFLQRLKASNTSAEVRRRISQAVGFKFHRENRPLSQNPANDHEVILIKSIPLPLSGWIFRTDPENSGHLVQPPYYLENLPDSEWSTIAVGQAWESQGFKDYDGYAWYRLKFSMPEKIDSEALELCFGAVDECAWVWLNGVYIGQHDEGPKGWSKPFRLDVTKEIRWGAENTLVVRVEDTEQAGGIWKPVTLEVLKCGN